jgi:hypothetical protein
MKYAWITVLVLFIIITGNVFVGRAEQSTEKEFVQVKAYDPNSPLYAYLEVAEPNWVSVYGDTAETRIVYNISKNRVMTAMIAKRLLALENPVEPNAVDPNEVKQ